MGKEGHVPKAPKSKKKKKKSPAKTERKAAPLSTPDDVDDFVAGRHELKLHGNNYDDDDDDEEDEVLALQGPDSDDDEDEDEDEEGGKFDDGDEDEDEDEDAEATGTATAGWGRKKKDFYGGDSADDVSDDEAEEAARLEQEEVLRLQRDHAAGLEADDFGELDPSAEGAEGADRPSDAQLLARLNEELEAGAAGMNVEAVERDMSRLSEKEKRQLVEKDAPELLQLLSDFKGHMREVRERIAPLLAAARQKQLGQEGGVSFLELKLQLLLSYCVNISFYLLLKAQGRPVREHPVIDALLRHRLLIERLRPLDQKLKYRLQKLLQLASGADASSLSESQRELQLRPNPDAMLLRNGDAADLDAEADGEEGGGGGGGGGAYRPPKLAAVPYEEEKGTAKRERQRQRQVQRASNSRLVRELRAEVSEEPESIHQQDFSGTHSSESGEVQRVRREEMEQREYEESNFTRLQLSKEAKREQRRRAARAGGAVNELDAFDDFSHLYNVATASAPDPQEEKMRALQQYMNKLEQRGKKGRRSADEDTPRRDESERAAKAQRRSASDAAKSRVAAGDDFDGGDFDEGGGGGGGGGGGHEEDPFYAQAAEASAAKRERKAAKNAPAVRSGPAGEMLDAQIAGETRAVGRDILKNRGLTRERKTTDRNPRVKNKEKYRKAVISRGGQVRKVIAQDGTYAGETSGIKKNVSHSVRYK